MICEVNDNSGKGSPAIATIANEAKRTVAVAWSPDGGRIAVGSQSGIVEIVETESEQVLYSLATIPGELQDLYWHPEDDLLAVNLRSQLQIWNLIQAAI